MQCNDVSHIFSICISRDCAPTKIDNNNIETLDVQLHRINSL